MRSVLNSKDRLVQVCTAGGLVPDILKRLGLPTPRQLDRGAEVAAPRLCATGVSLSGRNLAVLSLSPDAESLASRLGQGLTSLGATVDGAPTPSIASAAFDGLVVHCGPGAFDTTALLTTVSE